MGLPETQATRVSNPLLTAESWEARRRSRQPAHAPTHIPSLKGQRDSEQALPAAGGATTDEGGQPARPHHRALAFSLNRSAFGDRVAAVAPCGSGRAAPVAQKSPRPRAERSRRMQPTWPGPGRWYQPAWGRDSVMRVVPTASPEQHETSLHPVWGVRDAEQDSVQAPWLGTRRCRLTQDGKA